MSNFCCHVHVPALGIFPLLLPPALHLPTEGDFHAASQSLEGFGNDNFFALPSSDLEKYPLGRKQERSESAVPLYPF